MDLSKLSESDLQLLARGDVRMMSEAGLRMLAGQAQKQEKPDYESAMQESTLQIGPFDTGVQLGPEATQFLAGMGKRFSDIGTLGMRDEPPSDKALMEKGWAQGGSAVADLSTLIGGGAAIRGAGAVANAPKLINFGRMMATPATATEAALTGGAYSAATTNGSLGDRALSGAIGTVAGAAVPAGAALWRGGKALVEPLTAKGQQAIAGRTLRRFAGDKADDVANQLARPEVFVPGSIPTAAEASGNSGIAALQNGLSNVDKGGFGNALQAQQQANRAARVAALETVARDDVALEAANLARRETAQRLYGEALDPSNQNQMTPWLKGQVTQLLKRPSINEASKKAQRLAMERGEKPAAQGSLRAMHDVKTVLDDMIAEAKQAGKGGQVEALRNTQDQLLTVMRKLSDKYDEAMTTYARDSLPINQMEIGRDLLNTLKPALSDFGAGARENASTFTKALRNADATAVKATGFRGATMDGILSPDQLAAVTGVAKDLGRKANADDMIRGVGSNTAQNLATQNALRQAFGPLGLPETWAESAILQTFFKPLSMIYSGVGEQRIADQLGRGLLDPEYASRLMLMRQAQPALSSGLLAPLPAASIAVLPQFAQQK